MNIGEQIKNRRKGKFTQKELAKIIGKSERMIQKYESNDVTPNFDILNKIATALDIPISQLIGDNLNLPNNFTESDKSNIYKLLSDSEFCKSIMDYMGYCITSCSGENIGDPQYTITDSENNKYTISQNELEELRYDLLEINKFELSHFFEKIKRR